RRAPGQPDDLAVAARDRHAADRRRLHVVEFLTALLLGLAAARRPPAGPAERALGAAAATAAATGPRRAHPGTRTAAATATGTAGTATAATAGTTPATGTGAGAAAG